ncbi:GTF3C5 family protein [Megaselia abdita]
MSEDNNSLEAGSCPTDTITVLDKTNLTTELVLVEYPGIVKNVEKMINTLGGNRKISEVFSTENKRLELRYHPGNPYNKPVNGDSHRSCGILLKVKIKKQRIKSENNVSSKSVANVTILGHVTKAYRFNSLCDFQYLPIMKDPVTKDMKYVLNELLPPKPKDCEQFFNTPNSFLFLPPFSFSKYDTVYSRFFRDNQDAGRIDLLKSSNPKTYDSKNIVSFSMSDPIPMGSAAETVKNMAVKYVSDDQLNTVKKMFEECPVWTRIALLYESKISHDKMKAILPHVAYYYVTGPWRTMYVRYGYDPRKEFSSRFHQTFDYRVRFNDGITEFVRVRSQGKLPENHEGLVLPLDYPYLEMNYLPRSRQCILRYSDIRLPQVQEMLQKVPTPLTGAVCTEKYGWLPQGFDNQVRQIVASYIKVTMTDFFKKQKKDGDGGGDDESIIDDEAPFTDDEDDLTDDIKNLVEEMDVSE